MSTRYSRIKDVKEWVRWNTHTADDLADLEGIDPSIRESLRSVEDQNRIFYDETTRVLKVLGTELVHTQSADRIATIEGIRRGMSLSYAVRGDSLVILSSRGSEVGDYPSYEAGYFLPLIINNDVESVRVTAGEVVPRSLRGKGAKKAICNVDIEMKIKPIDRSEARTVLCILEGDQVNMWVQKLQVKYLNMPASDLKLMFEVYNRQMGEYEPDKNDTGYAGLDNLAEEITAARAKMRSEMISGRDYSAFSFGEDAGYYIDSLKQIVRKETSRYGHLLKYYKPEDLSNGYVDFKSSFDNCVLDEETYYWIEQTRVGQREYDASTGWLYHHYEIMEAFEGDKLPVDLKDEDVVSIFGTGKFIAFADLSYGC